MTPRPAPASPKSQRNGEYCLGIASLYACCGEDGGPVIFSPMTSTASSTVSNTGSTAPSAQIHTSFFPPQAALPMSVVEFPPQHRSTEGCSFSSSFGDYSTISNHAKSAAATLGSPPRKIPPSRMPDDMKPPQPESSFPVEMRCGAGAVIAATGFRLEPRYRGGVTGKCTQSPFAPDGSTRGRKRPAQSISPHGTVELNTSGLGGTDEESKGKVCELRHLLERSPIVFRHLDAAAFNLQELSLESPTQSNPTLAEAFLPLTSTMPRDATSNNSCLQQAATLENSVYASSPASFTGNSSCFSKVVTTPVTAGAEISFRCRSNSFGSVDNPSSLCRPPHHLFRGSSPMNITSSSPKIVPLTVLTHAPPTSRLYDAEQKLQQTSPGISQPVFQQQSFAADRSELFTTGTSSGIMMKRTKVRGDYFIKTPRFPTLSSVNYQSDPNSLHDTPQGYASIASGASPRGKDFQESFFSRSSDMCNVTPRSAKLTPLPKVTLTPRSATASNGFIGLPRFPSPTDDTKEVLGASLFSTTSTTGSRASLRIAAPPLLDVSFLSEHDFLDESCSLDLSVDDSHTNNKKSSELAVAQFAERQESYIPLPDWGYVPHRTVNPAAASQPSGQSLTDMSMHVEVGSALVPPASRGPFEGMLFEGEGFRNADTESLTDDDGDEFLLAVPSAIAEEKQKKQSGSGIRQSKLRRMQVGLATAALENQRFTSMTSLASSTTSLRGIDFALSSTSLRGMDVLPSNSNLPAMDMRNMSIGKNMAQFCTRSDGAVVTINCCSSMRREASSASIGLDLEPVVSGRSDYGFSSGRDLVTPPTMAQAEYPPPLSPRFGYIDRTTDKQEGHRTDPTNKTIKSLLLIENDSSTNQAAF